MIARQSSLLDGKGTLRQRRFDDSQGQPAALSGGFGGCLFVQWRKDPRSVPRIAERLEYPDYEVILVDDGSKDHTQQIAMRHPRVINIRQENSG